MTKMTGVVIESVYRDDPDGSFWIDIYVDRRPHGTLGPCATRAERERMHDDLMETMAGLGAVQSGTKEH